MKVLVSMKDFLMADCEVQTGLPDSCRRRLAGQLPLWLYTRKLSPLPAMWRSRR